jgi:hypothetical protein
MTLNSGMPTKYRDKHEAKADVRASPFTVGPKVKIHIPLRWAGSRGVA